MQEKIWKFLNVNFRTPTILQICLFLILYFLPPPSNKNTKAYKFQYCINVPPMTALSGISYFFCKENETWDK